MLHSLCMNMAQQGSPACKQAGRAWRDDQSEADLVPFDGAEKVFRVADKRVQGGEREQVWNFASRPQCLTCHTPWAEVTLGFNFDG